jgi:hypothetical protein
MVTLCGVVIGIGVGRLTASPSTTPARVSPPIVSQRPSPVQRVGTCKFDDDNLFLTIAAMPGDVAAQVVAQFSPDSAALMDSYAATISPGALPPPPDAPTLAHLLSRLSTRDRTAVLSGLSLEQQAAINTELLSTGLVFMSEGRQPPCP